MRNFVTCIARKIHTTRRISFYVGSHLGPNSLVYLNIPYIGEQFNS